MRNKSKVKDITDRTTATQVETYINNQLDKGWQFIQVVVVGAKVYAIFVKAVAL